MTNRLHRARGRLAAAALSAAALTALVVFAVTGGAQASGTVTPVPAPPRALIAPRPVLDPVVSCSQLMGADFTHVPGAPPASLTGANLVGSGPGQYCDVTGYISPQTQFELRLPTRTYQGRYLQTGCGGNCGVVSIGVSPTADTEAALTSNTFAVSTNNEGHAATGPWDVWAAPGASNPLRAQFGYLADHDNAVVAKAIIATFYGAPPAYSYFDGYSDGGRAAVQEAQRYPGDFNGILAGAPAIEIQDALVMFDFAAQHLYDATGQPIFDAAAIATLHGAALQACGVDGQINDPRLCHWNPAAIQCRATVSTNCLTAQQVQAAQAMYRGPVTPTGQYMWPGGESYGSELAWPGFAAAGIFLGGDNFRFMAFATDPPPSFTWRDLKFTTDTWRALQVMGAVYDANNDNHPNLNAFARAGGKLVVWQSWQDEAGGAYSVPDWYAQVAREAGGLAAAKQFARVFMLPTGSHAEAAGGAIYKLQILPSLINWVEKHQAPTKLDAWQTDASGAVTRTWPVYALPEEARYSGHGNIDNEASYVPYAPITDLRFRWLGDPRPAPFPYPGFPFAAPPSTRPAHPAPQRHR
jgi:hypothetical protein